MIHWSSWREHKRAWVRLGASGPGIAVTTRDKELFSVRNGHQRCLRLGNYTFSLLERIGPTTTRRSDA
jgi:hypothetical protein